MRLVTGPRREDYGSPAQAADRVCRVWNVLFADHLSRPLEPRHVVLAMIALKLIRESHRPKRDNVVDIAGYAWVLERVLAASSAAGSGTGSARPVGKTSAKRSTRS